jgi:AbrB family looped-hinge helix DNA binding protein
METVTLSSKFQVVIPQAIREKLRLKPGEQFRVISFGDRGEFMRVRPMEEFTGILKGKGIDPDIESEDDRL